MRFLIGSIIVFAGLLIMFFVGMFTQQTGLLTFAFCSVALFAHPMLVVALYRLFSGAAGIQIKLERTVSKSPTAQARRNTDVDRALGGVK